jgi:indolepyruvate ferredoxin oxidoreductase beta subunit
VLIDMENIARRTGAMVNAVMLGVIAGMQRLPIPTAAFEDAIRKDGKAVDNNLRGFRAGLEAVQQVAAPQPAGNEPQRGSPSLATLQREIDSMPAAARDIVAEGLRRLTAYQDLAYARLYIDRLVPVRAADEHAGAGARLLRETARHLAVRMSYEDVIRVAQAKIDPARRARIVTDMGVKPGEPFTVTEFLKPGIEEFCSVLPPRLAQRILVLAERRGWLGRVYWGMHVNSASVSGFLRFWLLAKLRRWRPRTYRFREEQREIERWLGLIGKAAALSGELALEVAECARLIKGYGDTHKRGTDNYRQIEQHVIAPTLAAQIPLRQATDAIASARTAALVDPDGESLAKCLGDIESQSVQRIAAE